MKFILSRYPSCCNHSYTIQIYDGVRKPLNDIPNDLSSHIEFKEGSHDSLESAIEYVKDRIEEIGDDPDHNEMSEIYGTLYMSMTRTDRKVSEYATMVRNVVDRIHRSVISYFNYKRQYNKIPDTPEAGFFEIPNENKMLYRNSDLKALIIKSLDQTPLSEPLTAGQEIFLIKVNNGYGCMTTCIPLGIFFHRDEAELFKKKVEDAMMDFRSDPEYDNWCNCEFNQYVLQSDLKTFK